MFEEEEFNEHFALNKGIPKNTCNLYQNYCWEAGEMLRTAYKSDKLTHENLLSHTVHFRPCTMSAHATSWE